MNEQQEVNQVFSQG